MNTIDELKKLMRKIGIEEGIVNGTDPAQPLAGRAMDSIDYPAFIAAVEERYGIIITDRYSLKLRSLNDFMNFINGAS